MRIKCVLSAAVTALAIGLASSPASADLALPDPNCGTVPGTNCLVFDDFNVYSLALLNLQSGNGTLSPGDPYQVNSNGTSLQNYLVIGTGSGGQATINSDLITGGKVDDAFDTPNAAGGGTTNFLMNNTTANTQGSSIPGGSSTSTWDVDVQALMDYIGQGNQLGFFFNLNQTNTTSYLNNSEDALGWLAVTLTDSTGVHQSKTFYLDGNACNGQVGVPGSPNCDPSQSYKGTQPPLNNADYAEQNILPSDADHDEWAYIHGQICASPAGGVVHFGACDSNDHTNITVNQNLGANTAAFALYSKFLQDALLTGDYDKMSVDLRMAAVDNGFENLFIGALNVPEPLTVALFGAGLLGLTTLRRRKTKTA